MILEYYFTFYLNTQMACERVTAFQLYFMDNIESFNTVDEAYKTTEKEWKKLPKDVIYYYVNKEICLNSMYEPRHNFQNNMKYFFNYLN